MLMLSLILILISVDGQGSRLIGGHGEFQGYSILSPFGSISFTPSRQEVLPLSLALARLTCRKNGITAGPKKILVAAALQLGMKVGFFMTSTDNHKPVTRFRGRCS